MGVSMTEARHRDVTSAAQLRFARPMSCLSLAGIIACCCRPVCAQPHVRRTCRTHCADHPQGPCRAGQAYDSTQRSIFQQTVNLTAMSPNAPSSGDNGDGGATDYLRLRLLTTLAGTDRGFAVNSQQGAEVAAAAEALVSAGGPVDLTHGGGACQPQIHSSSRRFQQHAALSRFMVGDIVRDVGASCLRHISMHFRGYASVDIMRSVAHS